MEPAAIIVTPYSTGCCVAQEIHNRGYKLICLWSAGFSMTMMTHVPVSCQGSLKYDIVLDELDTIQETASAVQQAARKNGLEIVSCVCGGEAGVDLADALSEELGLITNGTGLNRRDKKVQQELAKAAGLRSVRQAAGKSFDEVEEFLKTERYPVIVKPLDSAGSDGVKLCHSFKEAKDHFHTLMNGHEMMVNGIECHEVLCQEFLKGKEYVVDHVSRNGVHKTVMVWEYDKRPANGSAFVYFGDVPIDSESPEAQVLIPYIRGVLDAMGVKNGPSHGEVIITEDGTPCLVEMNCRAHGGGGNWRPLCHALTGGINQIDATVDAYLDKEKFDLLPDKYPSPFLMYGQCVDLVSFCSGTVKTTPGYDVIKMMQSFVYLETHVKPGSKVYPTVDMATDLGTVVVMHANKDVLEQDITLIRQMEKHGLLFELEEEQSRSTDHVGSLFSPNLFVRVPNTPKKTSRAHPSMLVRRLQN